MKDFYQILGVPKKADDDEIKKAFRKLARQCHPDAHPNDAAAEARFKEISEAYETLGDTKKRQEYDMARLNPFAGGPFGQGHGRPAGHGGPGGPGGPAGGGFGGLDEILNTFFRSSSGQGVRSTKGQNLEVGAEISLEEAVQGTEVMLNVTPPGGPPRRLRVPIPAGVSTGTKVRVSGEGESGAGGGLAGDLFVKVVVRSHPRFIRDGDDLHLALPLPVFDAVLGAEVSVPLLEGDVKLKIPPGTQGGKVFRFKNKGVPHLKGGGRGTLFVTLSLQIPEVIAPTDLELWQRLASTYRA